MVVVLFFHENMDITAVGLNKVAIKAKRGLVRAEIGESVEITSSGRESAFVVTQPGEYEVEGISVFVFATELGHAALIQTEDIKVLIAKDSLKENYVEEMDIVDVVVVGLSEGSNKNIIEMLGKIEPSYVLPIGEKAAVEKFLKDFERSGREAAKLSLNKSSITADATEVVLLNS